MLPVTDHGDGPTGRFVRPRHSRVRVPLGPLERDAGVFVSGPGQTRDIRNLLLRGGTAQLREGLFLTGEGFTESVTDILGMKYLPVEDVTIVVAYNRASGEAHVFRASGDGTDDAPEYLGPWVGFLAPLGENEQLPVVVMTESYQKVFMAHDELSTFARAPTYVYDPLEWLEEGALGPLRAEWAGGDGLIRFRGVVAYMDYVVGWGFATNGETRPEMVRISLPGEPLRVDGTAGFELTHWVTAGSRGQPVTACAPVGGGMVILKASEMYPLLGTSPATFGVGPAIDQKFGCIGPNLWTNLNGVLYVWSHEGPRATTGGPLEDLAIPLDLDGPSPDELQDPNFAGFATYVPETRVILFVFRRWVFAMDVRGGPGGWSYWELGQELNCAEVLYLGAVSSLVPPVAGPTVESVLSVSDTGAEIEVGNAGNTGTEWIEAWYRLAGDDQNWLPAQGAGQQAVIDDVQTITLTELIFGEQYEAAFRYSQGGVYHEDYEGEPHTWPSTSRTSFSTTAVDVPVGTASAVWERTSATEEQITLGWTPIAGFQATIEKSLDGSSWSTVDTLEGNSYEYEMLGGEGEVYLWFRVTYPDVPGTITQVARIWGGPLAPRNPTTRVIGGPPEITAVGYNAFTSGFLSDLRLEWAKAEPGLVSGSGVLYYTEVRRLARAIPGGSTSQAAIDGATTTPTHIWQHTLAQPDRVWNFSTGWADAVNHFALRHMMIQYGIADHSPWTEEITIWLKPGPTPDQDYELNVVRIDRVEGILVTTGTDCATDPAEADAEYDLEAPCQYLILLERSIDGGAAFELIDMEERGLDYAVSLPDSLPFKAISPPVGIPVKNVVYTLTVFDQDEVEIDSLASAAEPFAGVEDCP